MHDIKENSDGSHAFFTSREPAWHRLGLQVTPDDPLTKDYRGVGRRVGMDFEVKILPYTFGDGTKSEFKRASVRVDSDGQQVELGGVGMEYTPLQFEDAFAIIEPLCNDFGMSIDAAGALGRGQRLWMLLRAAEGDTEVIPGDKVQAYLWIGTSHDGSKNWFAQDTLTRVVCQNTWAIAEGRGGSWMRVSHTSNVVDKVKAASELVKTIFKSLQMQIATLKLMAAHVMSVDEVQAFVEEVFPNRKEDGGEVSKQTLNRRKAVLELVYNGQGQAMANQGLTDGRATAWAVFNAVTEYFDHVRPTEVKSGNGQKALESALFGPYAEVKRVALRLIKKLVA